MSRIISAPSVRKTYVQSPRIGKISSLMHSKEQQMTPHEMWEHQFNKSKTKLTFLILIYLYTQDDGEVSFHERRSIKKLIKKNESYLNQEDYDEIMLIVDELPDYQFVMDYISKNKVNSKLFLQSVDDVKRIIKKNKVYNELLSELKSTYQLYNS